MTDTAVVQEHKLQEQAAETNNDTRWRVFTLSKKRRDKVTQVLKAAIIGQMVFRPLVAWLEYLYATSEATNRLVNTTADSIDNFPYWLSFGIIACSIAWLWRRAAMSLRISLGAVTVSLSLVVCYHRSHHPEVVTQSQAHVIAFWAAA
jgi:hypothetical protein